MLAKVSIIQQVFSSRKWRLIPCLYFPFTAAMMSCSATLFMRVLYGFYFSDPAEGQKSNFSGVLPIVFFIIIPCLSASSYFIMNKGMKHFDSIYLVPLLNVAELYNSIMCGGILLDEFCNYDEKPFDLIMFLVGIII